MTAKSPAFHTHEDAQGHLPDVLGVAVTVVNGTDGATVVYIDTDEEMLPCTDAGPGPLRILLNDAPVYENPGYHNVIAWADSLERLGYNFIRVEAAPEGLNWNWTAPGQTLENPDHFAFADFTDAVRAAMRHHHDTRSSE